MKTFSKRLFWLLSHQELSRAEFAQKLGISVSSLSHLLSERNLPGMDLLTKMCREFPGLNPGWLLLGEGEPIGQAGDTGRGRKYPTENQDKLENQNAIPPLNKLIIQDFKPLSLADSERNASDGSSQPQAPNSNNNNEALNLNIEQVMIFYSNGTFKVYKP